MKEVKTITVAELTGMAEAMYGNLVKTVVDVVKNVVVVDMEMHVDAEQYLLEHGSKQSDLWGINLHPARYGTHEFIEFDSMINIRPSQKNLSRNIEDPAIRKMIEAVIQATVQPQ